MNTFPKELTPKDEVRIRKIVADYEKENTELREKLASNQNIIDAIKTVLPSEDAPFYGYVETMDCDNVQSGSFQKFESELHANQWVAELDSELRIVTSYQITEEEYLDGRKSKPQEIDHNAIAMNY